MANDDIFTATTTWQAVEANGIEIKSGVFKIFNKERNKVELLKAGSLPAQSDTCSTFMDKQKDTQVYIISAQERLYARTRTGTSDIGVTEAG